MIEDDFERQDFYIDDEGIGKSEDYRQDMTKKALQFAMSLIKNDTSVSNIVFLCSTKEKGYQWLPSKLFDSLWNYSQQDNNIQYRATSLQTYRKCCHYYDIVICMGCFSSALNTLDRYTNIKYIISLPWIKAMNEDWILRNNATKIK